MDSEEAVGQGTEASERTSFEPFPQEPEVNSFLHLPVPGKIRYKNRFACGSPMNRPCQLHKCVSSPASLRTLHCLMLRKPKMEEDSDYNLDKPDGMSTSTETPLSVDYHCPCVGRQPLASAFQFPPMLESSEVNMGEWQIPHLGHSVNKGDDFPLSSAMSDNDAELCETLEEPCRPFSPPFSGQPFDNFGMTLERLAMLHMQRRLFQQRKMAIQHEQMAEKKQLYTNIISMLTDISDVLVQCREELGWDRETHEQCREMGQTSQQTQLERHVRRGPTLRMGLRSNSKAHGAEVLTQSSNHSTVSQSPNYSEQTVTVQEDETRLNAETLASQCDAHTFYHKGGHQSSNLSWRAINRQGCSQDHT